MAEFGVIAPVVFLLGMNLAAFVLFGLDKSRARRGAWRIPERVLLAFALLGGSAGALVGMRLFHHKTRKPLFAIGVPALLIAHIALISWISARF